jgi:hypothetical protein
MKKAILFIFALCLLPIASPAQKLEPKPNSGGAGCLWLNQCGEVHNCVFVGNPGVGCDATAGCETCFRGLVQSPTDPAALDLTRQFVGYMQPYRWKQYTALRFVVAMAGPLGDYGVEPGDVVSRVGGRRANRRLFMRALPLKGQTLTIYRPGKIRVRRVRL